MGLYQVLATAVDARSTCAKTGNDEWFHRHSDDIEALVHEHMPSGGGFDAGTKIDLDNSTGEKLVFHTSYHHMNDVGSYDGWTEHTVIVRPSLKFDFDLKISGRDRNGIKEMIHEIFDSALRYERPPRIPEKYLVS